MQLTRNQVLLIAVVCVLLLKVIFAEIYFKKSIYPVNGGEISTAKISQLKVELWEAQLKLIEKSIEFDLMRRKMQKMAGQKELERIQQYTNLDSFLSDPSNAVLKQIFLDENFDLSEEGFRKFIQFLKENEHLLVESKRNINELISEDGSLPFLNTLDQQREPNTPLFLSSGGISKGASLAPIVEEIPVFEFKGPDRIPMDSGIFMIFIKETVKTIFDIAKVVVANKELFLIFGIFIGLIVGLIILYTMHFR